MQLEEAKQVIADVNEGKAVDEARQKAALVVLEANGWVQTAIPGTVPPTVPVMTMEKAKEIVAAWNKGDAVNTHQLNHALTVVDKHGQPLFNEDGSAFDKLKQLSEELDDGIDISKTLGELFVHTPTLGLPLINTFQPTEPKLFWKGKEIPMEDLMTPDERLLFNGHLVATAVMSFLAHLTSLDEPVTLSARHNAAIGVEHFRSWCEKMGIHDDSDHTQMKDWVKEVRQIIRPQEDNYNG